jgi:uncharacterized membrane protein YeaQ/YmgE (transglycosylase-associated protein family)
MAQVRVKPFKNYCGGIAMFIGTIIGWLVAGLIVGALARALVPGRQSMGIGLTIVLGIMGAIVGGFISSMLFGPNIMTDGNEAYTVMTAWPGWIMAIIGGAIVLWVTLALVGTNRSNRI